MFLKKNKQKFLYFFILIFLVNIKLVNASENKKFFQEKIYDYLSNTDSFSSNFLQASGKTIEEGSIYIDDKRIRVEYLKPSKIRIIMNNKKVMYFNIDLQEVEYFNPKESIAEIFYNIFYSSEFIKKSKVKNKKSFVVLEREVEVEGGKTHIHIFFEKQPFILRKIQIKRPNEVLSFGLFNIDHNSVFDEGFFSMVNPMIIK
tara:strand:+ start:93 stop:698 length:606 start_codon:yes stop_codon:yes gene_type:complete